MKLTKEEQELILLKRAKEEADKPKRMAFLKHDLYNFSTDEYGRLDINISDKSGFWLFNEQKVQEILDSLKPEKVLNKGCKFVSYIDDGQELWYEEDSNWGVEGVDNTWAAEHLENFQKYGFK